MSGFNPQPKPEKTPKKEKKPLKRTGIKKKKAFDSELWDIVSIHVRILAADEYGMVECFTCGKRARWKGDGMQAGHGIPRQHFGTRYNMKNLAVQCGGCNHFQQGAQVKFKEQTNKKYGPDTWTLLEAGKDGKKPSESQMKLLYKYHKSEAERLAKEKGLTI
jgi:hypothetical protein